METKLISGDKTKSIVVEKDPCQGKIGSFLTKTIPVSKPELKDISESKVPSNNQSDVNKTQGP